MKNYVYCKRTEEGLYPVITMTDGRPRLIKGYNLLKLQYFVEGNGLCVEDGKYLVVDHERITMLEDVLNFVLDGQDVYMLDIEDTWSYVVEKFYTSEHGQLMFDLHEGLYDEYYESLCHDEDECDDDEDCDCDDCDEDCDCDDECDCDHDEDEDEDKDETLEIDDLLRQLIKDLMISHDKKEIDNLTELILKHLKDEE